VSLLDFINFFIAISFYILAKSGFEVVIFRWTLGVAHYSFFLEYIWEFTKLQLVKSLIGIYNNIKITYIRNDMMAASFVTRPCMHVATLKFAVT
jgi:hypothetical protein